MGSKLTVLYAPVLERMVDAGEITPRGADLIRRWARRIFESPARYRSAAERGEQTDPSAETLNDIHVSRFKCTLTREQMMEWLGYTCPRTFSRALRDARAAGLVYSWFAPGKATETNQLIRPDQADLALAYMKARAVAHLTGRSLDPVIVGGQIVQPSTPDEAVEAILAKVSAEYIFRLGTKWAWTGFKPDGLRAARALRAHVDTYAGESMPRLPGEDEPYASAPVPQAAAERPAPEGPSPDRGRPAGSGTARSRSRPSKRSTESEYQRAMRIAQDQEAAKQGMATDEAAAA